MSVLKWQKHLARSHDSRKHRVCGVYLFHTKAKHPRSMAMEVCMVKTLFFLDNLDST